MGCVFVCFRAPHPQKCVGGAVCVPCWVLECVVLREEVAQQQRCSGGVPAAGSKARGSSRMGHGCQRARHSHRRRAVMGDGAEQVELKTEIRIPTTSTTGFVRRSRRSSTPTRRSRLRQRPARGTPLRRTPLSEEAGVRNWVPVVACDRNSSGFVL